MAVQLRVGRVAFKDTPRGGVAVLGGHHLSRVLLDMLPAVAAAHGRHRLGEMRHRFAHGRGVRGLHLAALAASPSAHTAETDFGALNVRSIPPPRPPVAPPARSHSPLRGWRPSISAMKSGPSIDAALDPQPRERVRARKPPAGGLGGLPLGAQVVVAALWLHGL